MTGKRKGASATLLGLLTLALFTSVALGTLHIKSGSYSGTLAAPRSTYVVKFKVSANAKKITGLQINSTPFYCQGGGPPTPVSFPSAKISKAGTFTSSGKYVIKVGPLKGQVGTKLEITGKFANGAEHGTLSAIYPKTPACTGKSSYSTKKS
ncbi:MAG TPA: hypothetical protein VID48_05520 [Solirubrobacteraceae bacterium]|jgi:hypothetical protein